MPAKDLYGFTLDGGTVVCVDCDIYPPCSEAVREPSDMRCESCGRALDEIEPVKA